MREFAKEFYRSKTWQRCRDDYGRSKSWLCERCLDKGLYKPGEIVHHKQHLTPDNIGDPSVTLSWDNLQLVCRDCHAELHRNRERRFRVDALGRVTV